jgi:hypothetical protein
VFGTRLRPKRAAPEPVDVDAVVAPYLNDESGQSTYCHRRGATLIGRDRYDITEWHLDTKGKYEKCGTPRGRIGPSVQAACMTTVQCGTVGKVQNRIRHPCRRDNRAALRSAQRLHAVPGG